MGVFFKEESGEERLEMALIKVCNHLLFPRTICDTCEGVVQNISCIRSHFLVVIQREQ